MKELDYDFYIIAKIFWALPATIMHYVTEGRKTKSDYADDERLIDDLWRTAQHLERRVDSWETILDRESPDWRDQYGEGSNVQRS